MISGDAAAEGMVTPGRRNGHGAALRFVVGFHGIYLGGEIAALALDAPLADTVVRGIPMPVQPGGAVEMRFLVGAMRTYGRALLGAEVGAGLRDVFADAAQAGEERFSAQGLIDVRARGGLWLSRYVSLSIQLGAGLVRDEYMTSLVLGVSPVPYAGSR